MFLENSNQIDLMEVFNRYAIDSEVFRGYNILNCYIPKCRIYNIEKQDTNALLELFESMGYTSFWAPREHFVERYLPSKEGPKYYMKLLVRVMTPPVKQELVMIDLRIVDKDYSLVTTFHPDSKFKLRV